MDRRPRERSPQQEPSDVKVNPNLVIKIIMKKMDNSGGSWEHDTNNNDGVVKVKKESAAKEFCKNLFNLSSSSSSSGDRNNNSQQPAPVTSQYTKVTVDGLMSHLTLHQSRLPTNVNQNSDANKRCNSTSDEQRSVESDARARRALEIQEGVESTAKPEGYTSSSSSSSPLMNPRPQDPCTNCHQIQSHTKHFGMTQTSILPLADGEVPKFHSQDYYCHFLVPDLEKITSCCYYWGKMDRYEAEKLLDGKPEGTFLLRDSAQDDYLFSVSFRKYGRSLHARIEQWNHKFSFDSHDPSVYTASTVTGLVEHYKDPTSVMFFEPMLTSPLHRNYVFSLQQLCRASIVSHTTYDGINDLCLPATMKAYLKEYHYKLKIRVRQFPEGVSNLTSS